MVRDERGLLATEMAILMPVLVVVALVAVFAVQVQRHGSRAQSAADSAARAAAYATSAGEASAFAQAAGERVCAGSTAVVAAWNPPDVGALRPGRVVVQLTCDQSFEAFSVLTGDSVRSVTATGVAAIEYWRDA